MSPNPDVRRGEELSRQARWVQGLAFAIVRDWQLAEDLSQEVLTRALNGEPRHGRVLRAWLAAVARNLSLNVLRERRRRFAREERAARPEEAPQPMRTPLEILEAHQELSAAVAALSPEQREVVMLRFFEDLDFTAIASRLGIRQEAARMRLHRALAAMRAELSSRGRDWQVLCAAALPDAAARSLQSGALLGGILLMNSMLLKIACAAGALLLFLVGAAWWLEGGGSPGETPVVEAGLPVLAREGSTNPQLERSTIPPVVAGEESEPGERLRGLGPNPRPVEGRVFRQGETVPDARVEIRQWGEEAVLTTDATGLFRAVLDPEARATVRVLSAVGAICREVGSWPVRIELEECRSQPNRVIVRDSLRHVPVSEASVRVFRCLRSLSGNYGAAEGGARLVTEGLTDREGVLAFGFDPGFYFFEVNAPGYCSYYGDVGRVGGGVWELELHPGRDPELFVLDEEGNSIPGSTAILGTPAYRRVEVEASGRVPGPIGWNSPPEDGALPFNLIVQLPGGRFWHASDEGANERAIVRTPERVECRISDPRVRALLQPVELPPGSWIEATRANARSYLFELMELSPMEPDILGTPAFLGGPWQRLASGEWTELERGWTGEGIEVCARLQPHGVWLGSFPVEDGEARIQVPPLARLLLEVSNLPVLPGVGAWELSGFERPYRPLDWPRTAAGSVQNAVSDHGRFEHWAAPGSHFLTLVHQDWGLELRWDGRAFREGIAGVPVLLHEGANPLRAEAILGPLREVRILVDGHPVLGGQLGTSRIDPHGRTLLAAEPDGSVRLANPTRLSLPPQLGLQRDSPVHTFDFLDWEGALFRSVDGEGELNFRLAAFLIDPTGLDAAKHQYSLWLAALTEGESVALDPQGRHGTPFADMRRNVARDIHLDPSSFAATYRLPEGRYMVWLRWTETQDGRKVLRHCDLTPLSGRHFPAGTQTVLSRQD